MVTVSRQSTQDREAEQRAATAAQRLQELARERIERRLWATRVGQGQPQDIARLTRAVERSRPGTRRRAAAVNKLSTQLLVRFRQPAGRDITDLITAIQLLGETGDGGSEEGPAEVVRLAILIECLEEWHSLAGVAPPYGEQAEPPRIPDLDATRRRLAAMASAPSRHRVRVLHACALARAAADGAAAGYDDMLAAVALLPRTAGWGRPRRNRRQQPMVPGRMTDSALVASDAAACAIASGRPVEAMELLETGRGVAWDQMLHATIRAEVRALDRGLVRRLDRSCRDLERQDRLPGTPDRYQMRDIASPQAIWPDTPYAATARRWSMVGRLTEGRLKRQERHWPQAAERAQALLPDATFQQVQYLADIRPAAAEGPVVAVVLSRLGCHALIVTANDDVPRIVNLPALTVQAAQDNARRYLTALNQSGRREREEQVQATLYWLWEAVVGPVLTALDLPVGQDGPGPRLWWCPSGPLAVLPLHAAIPRPPEDSEGDEAGQPAVISSYTPTLRSLISARKARDLRRASDSSGEDRLLLVSASDRAGQQVLPATTRFRGFLTSLIPAPRLTVLQGPEATIRNVRRALGRHSRAHFDCHGRQDPDVPYHTGLVLHDRDLTIADLAETRTQRPEFAFLAACSTAAPDHTIIDEMISVTSVLHYRGYQSVIGTMSPILDSTTERIAMAIYRRLADPQPHDAAAALLHDAVGQERRRRPGHPSTWVPFIHVGI